MELFRSGLRIRGTIPIRTGLRICGTIPIRTEDLWNNPIRAKDLWNHGFEDTSI